MNFSELFIRRPVMTTIVMAAILIFGAMAYRLLPVSDLPNVDFPTISVSASLPGANPDTMAASVATPLEKEFSTIAGVDSMTSSSGLGQHQRHPAVHPRSRHRRGRAGRAGRHRGRLRRQLPPDMPYPPTYRKVNPADQPILFIALTSPSLPLYELDEYGETMIAQRISMVSGVAQVNVYGGQKYAVRIQVDPRQLATRGIGFDDVMQRGAGTTTSTFRPASSGGRRSRTRSRPPASSRAPMPIGPSSSPTATASRCASRSSEASSTAWRTTRSRPGSSTSAAIMLAIQKQPGTNTVKVAESVRELLPTFKHLLPASVSMHIVFDRSESIRDSVNDVKVTLLVTLTLVVLVIFLFLRNLSATAIPSLAMPMSIVGTFGVMYAARLQRRQPLADGAHALGGFRGRRRHRHAREHLPSHGDGQEAVPGRSRRLTGDRLHDRLHDAFARRRLPAGAVHGRDRRAAVPRVRRDHRQCRPDLGLHLADADADALEPFPPAAPRGRAPRALQRLRARLQQRC